MLFINQKHNLARLTLSVLFALFAGLHISANEVTIGDLGSASDDSYLPMYSFYNYSYSQQIYTAEEIGMSGAINSLTLWLSGKEELPTMTFDIYMVETDKNAFNSTTDWVSVTNNDIVYSGTVTVHNTEAEAFTFDLDTPFEYSGEGNLVICFNNTTGTYQSGLKGKVFSATDNGIRTMYYHTDTGAINPTNPSFSAIKAVIPRNVIQLDITRVPRPDSFTVSDITGHTAKLSWTGGTGLYILDYKKASDEEWTNKLWNTTITTYTLEGLDSDTEYEARIKSVGANYEYSNYRTVKFTTELLVQVPTNITVTNEYNSTDMATAVLSWTQPDGADRWQVCLDNSSMTETMDRPFKRYRNLVPEVPYTFKVRAYNRELEEYSAWTDDFTFIPTKKTVIGSGTATNGNLPTYTYYKYSLTEQIYTAEELGDATAFKSIDFYSTATERTRNLDIYMVSTDKSSFTYDDGNKSNDWVSVSANDLVFSGEVTFKQNEWTTILLDYPYIHDGQSNMVLVVDDNTGSDLSNPTFYVFDAPGQAIRIFSDVNNYDPTSPSSYTGTVLNVKNQIRLQRGEAPPCTKPTNLTVEYTGGNTAVVSWTSIEPRFDLLVNDELIENVTSPYTLKDLYFNTEYVIQVRAKNDQGSSDWTSVVKFTTDASDNMCFVSLDLDDSYGDGWNGNAIRVYGVNYEQDFGEFTVPSDSKTAHFDVKVPHGESLQFIWKKGNYSEECSWVITDAFGEEIYSMEKGEATDLEDGTVFATFVVDCVGSEWMRPTNLTISEIGPHSAVLDWTENGEATEWVISLNTGGVEVAQFLTTFKPFTIPSLNPETEYIVKVKPNADDGTEKWSKEVAFTTDIPCPAPKEVAVNDIQQNSAVVSWKTNQETVSSDMEYAEIPKATRSVYNDDDWYYYDNGTYETAIGTGGSSFWWGVMFPADSYTGTALSVVSIYDFEAMTGTVTIFNDGDTAPENEITSKPITLTGAEEFVEVSFDDLSIDESKNLWVVVYNESGAAYPAAHSTEVTDDPNARWISLDGINWEDIADYNYPYPWMIRALIREMDNLVWIAVPNVSSPYTLTGLNPNTRYYVRVKANYYGGESAWKTTLFTTLGSSVPTGIVNVNESEGDNNWYSIDGKRLNEQPKAKGLYIRNGKKVVVK